MNRETCTCTTAEQWAREYNFYWPNDEEIRNMAAFLGFEQTNAHPCYFWRSCLPERFFQVLRIVRWTNPDIAAKDGIPAAHIGVEVIARVDPSPDGNVRLDPDRELVWLTIPLVARTWTDVIGEFRERVLPLLEIEGSRDDR